MANAFFITGTDTGIGKTLCTALLAARAVELGLRTVVVKPVQTGLSEDSGDLQFVHARVPGLQHLPEKLACPAAFDLPASPHLAAKVEGKAIDLDKLKSSCLSVISRPDLDLVLFEGAGGLLVPINEDCFIIDLIQMLAIPTILIADAGLGTINHSLLSIEALEMREIPVRGIIFNRMPNPAGSVEMDNLRIIPKLSGRELLAVIPDTPDADSPTGFDRIYHEFAASPAIKKLIPG